MVKAMKQALKHSRRMEWLWNSLRQPHSSYNWSKHHTPPRL